MICDEREEDIDAKERCPECGERGFYAAIGMFWIFRCDHCGHRAGNTHLIRQRKREVK